MRDFIDSILSFISSASLSDEEFGTITIEVQEYTAELYYEILLILEAREAVSSERDRLKAYFEAKGVSVTAPASSASKILIGGGLCGDAAAIPAGILGPRGPKGETGAQGETGPAGTTEFSGLEGLPSDNAALQSALDEKISNEASGKSLADLKIGDVEGGNYSEFESDGTLKFNGEATVWDDCLPSSVSVGTSGANVPSFTAYNGGLKAYEFVGTGTQFKEINFGFQMPHSYKEGSDVVPHLHLRVPNDASGGVIKFGMEYTWVNVNDPSAATVTVYGTLTVGANAGDKGNLILPLGTLAGAGKLISSILMMRIFRDPTDAADTFGASCWIKSADVHFVKDTTGSRQALVK